MLVESCIPVIPSLDLEKSLRFWVAGLGMSVDRAMRKDGRLVGCMVHNERLYFWLNERAGSPNKAENYEGIRLYWAPGDIVALRERLLQLGYSVSEIVDREYGQTEFLSPTTTAIHIASAFGRKVNSRSWRLNHRIPRGGGHF